MSPSSSKSIPLRHSLRDGLHAWLRLLLLCLLGAYGLGACSSGATALNPTSSSEPVVDVPAAASCSEPAPALPSGPLPRLVVQDGHADSIQGLAITANGRVLASSSRDGTVRIWDSESGLLLRRINAGGFALDVSLSASGNVLAYRSHTGSEVAVWVTALSSAAKPRRLHGDGAFQVAPDGKTVALGLQKLGLFEVSSGKLLREAKLGPIRALTFDKAGKRLAVSFDDELALLDPATFKILRRFKHPAYSGIVDAALGLVLHNDTLVLRTAKTVHLIDVTGTQVRSINVPAVHAAAVGKRLLLAEMMGQLSTWSLATGAAQGAIADGRTERVVVSADGSTLATAVTERNEHIITIRDARTMQTTRRLVGRTSGVTALAFRPDGRQLVTGSVLAALARWDLRTGELLGQTPGEETNRTHALSYDPKGRVYASVVGTHFVRVRDAATGHLIRQWRAAPGKFLVWTAFLPRGKTLLTLDRDGELMRWDLSAAPAKPSKRFIRFDEVARPPGKVVAQLGVKVTRAALSRDGQWLAISGGDKLMPPGGGRVIPSVVGQLLVASTRDGSIRWQKSIQTGAGSLARWVTFGDDGSELLHSGSTLPGGGKVIERPVPLLTVLSAASGKITRSERLDTMGPMAALDNIIAIAGQQPALYSWPDLRMLKRVTLSSYDSTVAVHRKSRLFAFGSKSGATVLISAAGSARAMLTTTADGEFLSTTPAGAYRASLDGGRNVAWTFEDPLESFTFEQFAARFDSPDSVRQQLGGQAPSGLARLVRPPSVTVNRAGFSASVSSRTVRIKAKVASEHRVDRLRVFVNGRPAADKLVCAAKGEVTLPVPLLTGKNRLTVVAYDALGYASNPQTLDVTSTATGAKRPELWVISVGVSRYPQLSPSRQLAYADDDARAIADAFAQQVGPDKTFAKLHRTTLLDDAVTPQSVTEALGKLSAMRPDDLAVVFLAGHGVRQKDGKMMLLTSGASLEGGLDKIEGVGWDSIDAALSRVRGRVLMLLDACHSGHVSTEVIAPNEQLAQQLAARNRSGVLVLAASKGSQLSYEVPDGAGSLDSSNSRGFEVVWRGRQPRIKKRPPAGHGLFTSALLEALQGQALDRDRSGAIEMGELIDYATERVRSVSNGKQIPWVARREMFGDFAIAPARR